MKNGVVFFPAIFSFSDTKNVPFETFKFRLDTILRFSKVKFDFIFIDTQDRIESGFSILYEKRNFR